MTEGYLICRNKEAVRTGRYDDELSKMFGLHVFWIDGKVTPELEKKCEGKFFSLEEIIFAGLKDLADKLGFEKYLKER
jgi:hypothetical protein